MCWKGSSPTGDRGGDHQQRSVWRQGWLQIATNAQREYHLDVKVPTLDDALRLLLERTTWSFAPSDKGRVASAMLRELDIDCLLSPGVTEAIRALTTPRAKELERVLRRMHDAGRQPTKEPLPHLLTIAALRRRSPATHVLPGTDVEFGDGTRFEVDLIGLHAGKLISGEVKSSAREFTAEQVRRDVNVSARLGADIRLLRRPRRCRRRLSRWPSA